MELSDRVLTDSRRFICRFLAKEGLLLLLETQKHPNMIIYDLTQAVSRSIDNYELAKEDTRVDVIEMGAEN